MQTIKKLAAWNCMVLAAAVTLFSGCGAPGPRALVQGKKLLDHGKYAQALDKLKLATSLLSTNAQAWNFLGLAYHHAGKTTEAENAYRRAFGLDPDLTEAHYNLGCLWLEDNKPEAARVEFTAYTLRRSNVPEGHLMLGTAQLRCKDLTAAERSFSDALRLDKQTLDAWVGLGLVRLQRGRPAEAVQYFQSALQEQPGYAPALLNMAIVEQQYLQNRTLALKLYRDYLALKPTPENNAAVNGVVRQLELEMGRPLRPAMTNAVSQINTDGSTSRTGPLDTSRPATGPKPTQNPAPASSASARPPQAEPLLNAAKAPSGQDLVQLPAESELKAAQDSANPSAPAERPDPKAAKHGFFQRLLGNNEKPATRPPSATASPETGAPASALAEAATPTPSFNRYVYRAPVRPATGEHTEAVRAFAQGFQTYKAQKLPEAIQAYRRATQLDPAYFDAHYNLGLVATEAGSFTLALAAYEVALAIQPKSIDTRYNFALTLTQANYPVDAANELEKILLASPNETRAHLALGNLFAQQLRQPAKARPHYLKVLDLDQHNPQAAALRSWLAEHARTTVETSKR